MIAIDSNVLLRYLLQDDAAQSPIADAFFAARTKDDPACVGLIVLVESWWVMRSKKVPVDKRVAAFEALMSAVEVVVHDADLVRVALRAVTAGADFADALITALYRARGDGTPVTFDDGAIKHAGMRPVTNT
jgi:predicted nucleic-acid-binding protein